MDFEQMTNAEIKLKMKSFEQEYELMRENLKKNIEGMKSLDELYVKASNTLKKRNNANNFIGDSDIDVWDKLKTNGFNS